MESASIPAMALAAGSAGCTAELITLPLDTVKVRMQVQSQKGTLVSTMRNLVANEGLSSPWRGLIAGIHRQLVFCTFRIAMYRPIRDCICSSHEIDSPPLSKKIMAAMTTGALGMCIANPTDVVKIRLQASSAASSALRTNSGTGTDPTPVRRPIPVSHGAELNPLNTTTSKPISPPNRYKGVTDAYRTIIRTEGVQGLWSGVAPNVLRNCIICAAELSCYDQIKEALTKNKILTDGAPCHLVSGLGAGFIATVVGSPVDVIKTRFMNAPRGTYKGGVIQCVGELAKQNGVSGFYKGFWPNFLRIGTFNIVIFVSYEQYLKRARNYF